MTHSRYVLPAMRARVHEVCALPAEHFVPAWPQRDAPARVTGDRRDDGARANPEPGSDPHRDPDLTTTLTSPSHEGPDDCGPQVPGETRARGSIRSGDGRPHCSDRPGAACVGWAHVPRSPHAMHRRWHGLESILRDGGRRQWWGALRTGHRGTRRLAVLGERGVGRGTRQPKASQE